MIRALIILLCTLTSSAACGQTDFVTRQGIEVHSHKRLNIARLEAAIDTWIKHAAKLVDARTIKSILENRQLIIRFVPDKIECPSNEPGGDCTISDDGERHCTCVGEFRPGTGLGRDLDTATVWLDNPDCPVMSALTHELGHYLLWQVGGDLTHGDRRVFVMMDSAGLKVSHEQAKAALETAAAYDACVETCPWLCKQ